MVGSVFNENFINNVLMNRTKLMVEDIQIEPFDPKDEEKIAEIIRRNLETFQDSDSVLSATFRRLNSLSEIYLQEGCKLIVARNKKTNQLVGCAGLGPLHGLPISEGVGEIRDMVVEENLRGLGLGSKLLHRCIAEAKKIGYKRLYLETSQKMIHARKLFLRTGFRPVTANTSISEEMASSLPCYFLLEDLGNKNH